MKNLFANLKLSRAQRMFRTGLFTVGLFGLFICFLLYIKPAYTNENQIYVYFDNGLSDYDKVEYSIDGGENFIEMKLLSENTDKYPANTENVNPENVFVSMSKIPEGSSVIFRGTASGYVYDTMTNYRVGNASREWGYEYVDFTWKSEAVTVNSSFNCYYAPPQLMQYKYGGVAATEPDGEKSEVQYIYAFGETDEIEIEVPVTATPVPENTATPTPEITEAPVSYVLGVVDYSMTTAAGGGNLDTYNLSNTGIELGQIDKIIVELSTDSSLIQGGIGGNNASGEWSQTDQISITSQSGSFVWDNIGGLSGDSIQIMFWWVNGIDSETGGTVTIDSISIYNADGELLYLALPTGVTPSPTPTPIPTVEATPTPEITTIIANIANLTSDYNLIQPNTTENRIFYNAEYSMGGKIASVNDINNIANTSQSDGSNVYEGSYISNGDGTNGIGSNVKVYNATANFYDYYSDWELAGNPLKDHMTSYTQAVEGSFDYQLGLGEDYSSNYDSENYYYNVLGSFSEGTNRISYSYQGFLWNKLLSDYYKTTGADTSVLYFGSNNFFTGNDRHEFVDRHGNTLFESTDAMDLYVKTHLSDGTAIKADNQNYTGVAIRFPEKYEYLETLYGFEDYPHGFSNSRAVEGLVDFANEMLMLNGTNVAMPYFSKSFIEGSNSENAVYGKVYDGVKFAFKYNEETGYYEYDSTKAEYATRVSYDNLKKEYYMKYTGEGVTKADNSSNTNFQFYPFNSPATNSTFATENLMFGMELVIPFNMYKDEEQINNSMFKFSGDDDVWIYVDDTLVLDIGGTHTAVGGIVDMKNGYSVLASAYAADTGVTDRSDGSLTTSGKAGGMTDIEKAAFALLASQDELNKPGSWISVTEADFFDEKYYGFSDLETLEVSSAKFQYTIDETNGLVYVKFNNFGTDNDGDGVVDPIGELNVDGTTYEGSAVFRLKQFSLSDNSTGGDLSEHELTIYYMERGLNSSNFKLAFNFIEHTEREVEKEWADGQDNHSSNDSVEIELYRTEPTESEVAYSLGDNHLINSIAYKSDGSTQKSTAFATKNDTVVVQFKPENEAVENGYIALAINGQLIDTDLFTALNTSAMNLKIFLDGVEITSDSFVTDDAGKSYLKLPSTGERTLVRVEYTATNSDISIKVNFNEVEHEAFKFVSGNAWFIEAYAYQYTTSEEASDSSEADILTSSNLSEINVAENKIVSHTTNKTVYVEANGDMPATEFYSDEMSIVNVQTIRSNWGDGRVRIYQKTIAVADTHRLEIESSVNDNSGNVIVTRTLWPGAMDSSVYETIAGGTYGAGVNLIADVKEAGESGIYNIRMLRGSDSDIANGKYGHINFPSRTTVYGDSVIYSNTELIDTITLNSSNKWNKVWTNIIESVEIDGENYNYIYYIRESKVTSSNGVEYEAVYYDANGKEIMPTYITYTPEGSTTAQTIKVYSIDSTGYVSVSNIPYTKVSVNKEWSTNMSESLRIPVTVNIYNSIGEMVDTTVLSKDNSWTYTTDELPLYTKVEDKWVRLEYYMVEDKLAGFIASYSSLPVKLTLENGNVIDAYPLNMSEAVPSGTVKNKQEDDGYFNLQLQKVAAEDNNKVLSEAEFTVETWHYYPSTQKYEFVTDTTGFVSDSQGIINFGELKAELSNSEYRIMYKLIESQAPSGYDNTNVDFAFVVSLDSTTNELVIESIESDKACYVSHTWNDETDTLTVVLDNEKMNYVLPSTGGIGTNILYIVGVTLLGVGVILLVSRRYIKHRS